MAEPEWHRANRANWDERVGVHIGPRGYDLSDLRAGHGRLNSIEEAELPPVAGKRILHLQCHFGRDSLILAQRGAEVVGLDSPHRQLRRRGASQTSWASPSGRALFMPISTTQGKPSPPHMGSTWYS